MVLVWECLSLWDLACMPGQFAIIFQAFLLIGLCQGSSTFGVIMFSPHSPLGGEMCESEFLVEALAAENEKK